MTEVPWRINEGRIADVLVGELEGIDRTSTFFEGVFRLPPAHALVVTPQGLHIWRYWSPEPGPILRLGSDEAYAEAFLEVFAQAVRSRLRGAGPVGSMLSGGWTRVGRGGRAGAPRDRGRGAARDLLGDLSG